MNSSMINAMVSMNGLQQKLDLLADNIANVNTVGYKRKEATFEDLLTNATVQPEAFNQKGRLTPLDFTQGWGAKMTMVQPNLSQGPMQLTNKDTDLAVEGNAMFEVVVDAAGNRGYTRNGAFQLTVGANGDTILATEDGYPVVSKIRDATTGNLVESNIVVPEGYSLRVNSDGSVLGVSSTKTIELGSIKLLHASRPAALTAVNDNLFVVANGINVDDVVQEVIPDSDNLISLRQGYLEQSNVVLTDEVTELINVQRAYQLAARALSSSDTMMSLANGLRA
ncbi:flagellar basal-body rod protein FlgG [Paenibacillus castaneae]|uniref:flagellar hook-basal body protein n=1 Tax=Paenibacillus castaneae TaxID=474957 RepID=UPI000C9A27B6|nr:flagellar hook-basal body protein [Paenibacillus castaneae]NIK79371.1 flagellar basal-body rod protein FlgG [Paenibacillus castaneae]